jgi:hypothetical protein
MQVVAVAVYTQLVRMASAALVADLEAEDTVQVQVQVTAIRPHITAVAAEPAIIQTQVLEVQDIKVLLLYDTKRVKVKRWQH